MTRGSGLNVTPTSGGGAQFRTNYHVTTHEVVGVPVMEIQDASSAVPEEFVLLSVGNMMASAAFGLGIERSVTEGFSDPLFLVSIAFFLCGSILAGVGFRQTRRRYLRLSRYIPEDFRE